MAKGNTLSKREIDEKTPLLVIAGPMFVELFLNILLNNVDTVMLSHYSEYGVGAVGNANQVLNLLIIMFNVISVATSVVVAQYLGAKQYSKMNMIYTLAVLFNLAVGVVLSAGILLFKVPLMRLLNVSEEMMPGAITYINIVGGGLFLQACYNVMLQILRCNGHTKVGMYISLAINLTNIFGNYMFLYGPLRPLDMGIAGVAISTVAARIIALTAAMVFFYRSKIGRISPRTLRPFPTRLLGQMIKIGLPSAGENFSYSLYQVVLLSFVNNMGNSSVTAQVYCNSLISFAMIFSNAAAMATQIITGHLVGAGKEDEAYKKMFSTLKISMPITVGLAVINWLLSPYTLHFFTDNEEIIHIAFYIMMADIFVEIGRVLNMTIINSLKAAGDCIYPLIVGLITMWALGVGVGYALGVLAGVGVAGVWFGTATDQCVRGLIVLRRWRKKEWYGKAVVRKA